MAVLNLFLQRYSNVFAENKLLKFGFLILLIATVANSIALYRLVTVQRTVVIPAGVGCEFELTGNSANPVYLKQMARYLLDLRANISAATARVKFNELLNLVPSKHYGPLKEGLMKLADDFEKHHCISQYIVIDEKSPITVMNQKNLSVKATKIRVAGKEIVRTVPVCYRIEYLIQQGRFQLLSIVEQEIGNQNAQ